MSTQAEPPGAAGAGPSTTPPLPVIRPHERYDRSPFLLVEGTSRMIGWVCPPASKGERQEFVIAARTALGGVKVVQRFPLNENGWARAWQQLRQEDPAGADKTAARLARRTAEDAAAGAPPAPPEPMLIVTANEVAGHRITAVHGDVFGLVVRSGSMFTNFGASVEATFGGEVTAYTRLLIVSRNQARERMWQEARSRGANAIVAMRFDCNSIAANMSEVVAYGTAVTVEPAGPPLLPEAAPA